MKDLLVDDIIESGTKLAEVLKQLNSGLQGTTTGINRVMDMAKGAPDFIQEQLKQDPEMIRLATHLTGISEILFEHQIYQAEYKLAIDKFVKYFLQEIK